MCVLRCVFGGWLVSVFAQLVHVALRRRRRRRRRWSGNGSASDNCFGDACASVLFVRESCANRLECHFGISLAVARSSTPTQSSPLDRANSSGRIISLELRLRRRETSFTYVRECVLAFSGMMGEYVCVRQMFTSQSNACGTAVYSQTPPGTPQRDSRKTPCPRRKDGRRRSASAFVPIESEWSRIRAHRGMSN